MWNFFVVQCSDIKKRVFLPLEINRGTVRFRRPQFGDDPSESQPVDFFFYFCIAVMQYWIISPVRLMPTNCEIQLNPQKKAPVLEHS